VELQGLNGLSLALTLHRYLAEFDFRYSNRAALGVSDAMRADKAMKGIVGKRLTYRRPLKEIH
jgi:hypothetical protein